MLWPLILPFKITFFVSAVFVVSAAFLAPSLNWKRGKTILIGVLLAVLAFVPSCTGIMFVVDGIRFGYFEYAAFDDVGDFRAERYLPTSASRIKMHKQANGYRAQYSITGVDFHKYLNGLWDAYGEYSVAERGFGLEGSVVTADSFDRTFGDLGWDASGKAVIYHGPVEGDGGGATYYFDSKAGVAFQRTGYW